MNEINVQYYRMDVPTLSMFWRPILIELAGGWHWYHLGNPAYSIGKLLGDITHELWLFTITRQFAIFVFIEAGLIGSSKISTRDLWVSSLTCCHLSYRASVAPPTYLKDFFGFFHLRICNLMLSSKKLAFNLGPFNLFWLNITTQWVFWVDGV